MSSAGRLDDEKFGQPRLRVVTAAEIERALGLADLLKTVERALVAYTAGRRRLARRAVIDCGDDPKQRTAAGRSAPPRRGRCHPLLPSGASAEGDRFEVRCAHAVVS
jgi:hypothetical protein